MKRDERGNLLFEDGTPVYPNESDTFSPSWVAHDNRQPNGILYGYDGPVQNSPTDYDLSKEHMIELAEFMIAEWTEFLTKLRQAQP